MPVNNCPQPKKTGSQTQKTAIYVHPVSGMSQSSQNVALSSFPKHLPQHSTKKRPGSQTQKDTRLSASGRLVWPRGLLPKPALLLPVRTRILRPLVFIFEFHQNIAIFRCDHRVARRPAIPTHPAGSGIYQPHRADLPVIMHMGMAVQGLHACQQLSSTQKNREPDTENRHLRPSCLRHVTVFSKRCTLLIPEALASTFHQKKTREPDTERHSSFCVWPPGLAAWSIAKTSASSSGPHPNPSATGLHI